MRKPSVFICSSVDSLPIAREFARQLETSADPILWSESFFLPGKTATDSLTEVADQSDFAVFIVTPDITFDTAGLRTPRSNVIFEMGFLAGRIGLSRTIIVLADPKGIELPTDLTGVSYVTLNTHEPLDISVASVTALIVKTIKELGLRLDRRQETLSSCFLSYSWADKDFAARLHDDLGKVGVRCWLDAKELRAGDRIYDQISRAIQAHDKVLVVLSQASIRSSWVSLELRKALEREKHRGSTVLFPLCLDDAVFTENLTDDIATIRDRLIIDFSEWHDKSQYQKAFSRLVRDLAINASVESGRRA